MPTPLPALPANPVASPAPMAAPVSFATPAAAAPTPAHLAPSWPAPPPPPYRGAGRSGGQALATSPDPAVSEASVSRSGPQRLLVGAAAGLVCGLLLTALWVAAAVATGQELAPAALLVGAAAGLAMRRLGPRGGPAALGAGLVALVAIGLELILSALAAYSHAEGASFLSALALLNRSFLTQLWAQTGVLGGLLGIVGVGVAGVAVAVGGAVDPPQGSARLAAKGRGAG